MCETASLAAGSYLLLSPYLYYAHTYLYYSPYLTYSVFIFITLSMLNISYRIHCIQPRGSAVYYVLYFYVLFIFYVYVHYSALYSFLQIWLDAKLHFVV